MSDSNIEVKFGADITSLLSGLKEGQESMKSAAEGMRGNLGSLVQAFEALGPAALAAGAAMLVFEGVKELINTFMEATEATMKLGESFKQLSITAGMSADDFNKYNAAVTLAGGSANDLQVITMGMQRGIKANADGLITNGIAADKAALSQMTLGQYISKVVEVMDTYGSATEKDQLLMEAFGRGGMQFARVLVEMNQHMKEGQALADQGGPLNAQSLHMIEEHEQAVRRLKLAQEGYNAVMALSVGKVTDFAENLKAKALEELTLEHQVENAISSRMILRRMDATNSVEDIQAEIAAYKQLMATIQDVANAGSMDVGTRFGPGDRATGHYTPPKEPEPPKEPKEPKEKHPEDREALERAEKMAAEERKQQEMIKRTTMALEREQSAEEKKVAKDRLKLQEELSQQRITIAQNEVARLKQLEEQKKANAHATYQFMTAGFSQSVAAGIMGQERWGQVTKQILAQALQNQVQYWLAIGEQRLEDAAVGLILSKSTSLAQIQEAAALAAANAFAAEAAIPMIGPAAAPGAAAAAYSETMSYGAFAAGAEGGWDRVPATQMALLHTNEMVLPAHIAEPVRQMAESGGGGGTQVHIHAADSQSFKQMFARNSGGIIRQVSQAVRRGRTS